jgi:hypothetical protein
MVPTLICLVVRGQSAAAVDCQYCLASDEAQPEGSSPVARLSAGLGGTTG